MEWSIFASIVIMVSQVMGNVLSGLDTVTLVTMTNDYDFTLLDMACAFMVYDSLADLIEGL